MFGVNATHVPAWMFIQEQGDGLVSFVGASRVPPGQRHPLRYGSDRTHQLVIGEIVVRPHTVHATDDCRGAGLAGLAQGEHYLRQALAGELLIGRPGTLSGT